MRCNKPLSVENCDSASVLNPDPDQEYVKASLYSRITGGNAILPWRLGDYPANTIAAADFFHCVATLFYIVGTKILKWPETLHSHRI